jgi:hypothetical protein
MARVHANEMVDDSVLLARAHRDIARLKKQVNLLQAALRQATAGAPNGQDAASLLAAAAAAARAAGQPQLWGGGGGGSSETGAVLSLYGGGGGGGGDARISTDGSYHDLSNGSSGGSMDTDVAAQMAALDAAPIPHGKAGDAYTRNLRVENAKLSAENRKLKEKLRKQKGHSKSPKTSSGGKPHASANEVLLTSKMDGGRQGMHAAQIGGGGGAAGYLRYDDDNGGDDGDDDALTAFERGGSGDDRQLASRLLAMDGRVQRLEAKKRADAEFAKPVDIPLTRYSNYK